MTMPRPQAAGDALSRDVEYEGRDFVRIADLLCRLSGIRMPASNEALVFSRLARRVRTAGFGRFEDYIDHVSRAENRDECSEMVAALTTNTTRFFREDYHYDILARDVVPRLADTARSGGRVRLWSAGCSSGEEVYSLAAVILAHFPDAAEHDLRILATDINSAVLDVAARGVYPSASRDAVPSAYRVFADNAVEGDLAVRPDLKALITFRYMNFVEPWPVRGPFDAIFCRNVMIYMEEDTQQKVWAALAEVMRPGGYLFIGHSERIGPEFRDRFELVGKTTFRRI